MVCIFREGEHIPLHDHPDMHGIIKCLAGSLKITSYTKLPVTSLPTNLPDKMKESSKIQEKLRCGMLRNEDKCWWSPGPRIVPSCHPGWGAVSDLGGSFAERGFKMGHRHSGTTTRAKTAPFQLSFHTLIFRCFVLIPSLCLLSASFFPLC